MKDSTYGLMLVIPAILFVGLIVLYPLLFMISLSVHESDLISIAVGKNLFVGLKHYAALMHNPLFVTTLQNTLMYVILSISLQLLIGLGLALILNQKLNDRGFFRTILISPMMIAPVIAGVQWIWIYASDYGVLNHFLGKLGLPTPLWLADTSTAIYSLIIVEVWLFTPFVMMILLASLQTHPSEPYESAIIDGATQFQVFRYIMLPLLKPAILVILIIRTMDALRVFDIVYTLTGGGPADSTEMLSTLSYKFAFAQGEFGKGSTVSVVLMAITIVVSLIYIRLLKPDTGS